MKQKYSSKTKKLLTPSWTPPHFSYIILGVKYKTLLNNWQSRRKKVPSRLNKPYLIWNKMGEWSISPSVSYCCCKLKLNESLLALIRVKKIKGRKLVVSQVQKSAHFIASVENTNMQISETMPRKCAFW